MSTEFVSDTTEELAFVRFARRGENGTGPSFEFGTMSNFEDVCRAFDQGETFSPLGSDLPGDPTNRAELEAALLDDRVTFGVFPVTVEVGSGDMFRFSVER